MRRRHGRVDIRVMIVLAVVSLALFAIVNRSSRRYRTRMYDEKLAAAKLSEEAFGAVRDYRLSLGLAIDSVSDPNLTGLVGMQFTQLTWGRADLSDALTTVNPNFSAALVELLLEAGMKKGDKLGISWDGTFPALNIQLLAVCRAMELEPVIITALSSGTWGANLPGFTWLDVETFLANRGLWNYRTRYATLGGVADAGRGLSMMGREFLAAAAESAGVELKRPATLDEAVQLRTAAYRGVHAVVSGGRVAADMGDPLARVPSRVITRAGPRIDTTGTIRALLESGIPVIFLGNPTRVALDYRLPVAPLPVPETGKGRLFFERRYSVWLAAVFAVVLMALLWLVVRYDIESYLGVRKPNDKEAV